MSQAKKTKQKYEKYFDQFALEISGQILNQAEGLLNQLSVEVPEVVQRLKNKSPRILGESLTLYCTWLNCHLLWLKREDRHKIFAEQITERVWKIFYDDLSKEMKYSPIKEQLAAWQEDIELQCLEYGLQITETSERGETYRNLASMVFKKIVHPASLYDDERTLESVAKLLQDLETYVNRWNDTEAECTEFSPEEVLRSVRPQEG